MASRRIGRSMGTGSQRQRDLSSRSRAACFAEFRYAMKGRRLSCAWLARAGAMPGDAHAAKYSGFRARSRVHRATPASFPEDR